MRFHLLVITVLTVLSARLAFGGPEVVNPDESKIVRITKEITEQSAALTVTQLYQTSIKNRKSIWVHIDSPGGSVKAGNQIIATMEFLRSQGIEISCSTKLAASMALHILAHCDNRYAEAKSKLLWHSVAVSWFGKLSWEDVKELNRLMTELETPLDDYLLAQLKIDRELFDKHRIAETLWSAEELSKVSPGFEEIVEFGENLQSNEEIEE